MKNVFKILAGFLSLLILANCEKDEYIAPGAFSDVTWYTSVRPGTSYHLNVGDFISFMNPSPGMLSTSWEIEEGNYFLKEGFTRNDSVLDKFIDYEIATISENTTVHILFAKAGLSKVHLHTTFKDSVAFIGADTIFAQKVENVWVIDKTFEIDVYSNIMPAFKVFRGEEEILNISGEQEINPQDSLSWPKITLEAGEALTYVDMTTIGRPNARTWNLQGGSPSASNDSTVTTYYYRMGTFSSTVTSRRTEDLPAGSKIKHIPLLVDVLKSTQPFKFGGDLKEFEPNKISFNVTGETANFFNQENYFTVHVSNPISGFSGNINVASAQKNLNDATLIELTLDEPIYNTDVVTVSYSGGNIRSLDERLLEDFGPESVELIMGENILDAEVFGFEIPAEKNGGAFGWWAQHPQWQRSEDQLASGVASMRFLTDDYETSPNAMTLQGVKAESQMLVPASRYRMSLKVWIDPSTNLTELRTILYPFEIVFWDLTNASKGEWVTISQDLVLEEKDDMRLQVNKANQTDGITGRQLLFIDDISFIELNERP
jgi:hypothetical protein